MEMLQFHLHLNCDLPFVLMYFFVTCHILICGDEDHIYKNEHEVEIEHVINWID